MQAASLSPFAPSSRWHVTASAAAPLFAAFACQAAAMAAIAVLVGTRAWDDGAITLAYSRSFAETGRIALTAASEQTEGFSSVAWFLINAAVALARPGFEGAILGAQLLAGLFLAIATTFAWLITRHLALRPGTTLAILITFSLFGPSIAETANGMEMTLLAAAGLGLCSGLYFRRSALLVAACGALFLLARFEAMVYFAGIIGPLLLQKRYRAFALLAVLGLGLVGLQEGLRYAIFHDIVPNTIHAKAQAPYYQSGLNGLRSRVLATVEPLLAVLPLAVLGGILFLRARRRRPDLLRGMSNKRDMALVLLAPIASVLAFSLLIGSNWGYIGRMQFLALPFMLLLFGVLFDALASVITRAKPDLVLIAATTATIGLSWPLSAAPIISPASHSEGITPATYRATGLAVDKLRQLLGKDVIVFLTPDVGGLGLCCSHIRVLDLGLLTNRRMAREGYGAIAAVLREEQPEVIEIHRGWARLAKLYELPEFTRNYRPALIDDTRLFVRNDVFDSVLAKTGSVCSLEQAACLSKAVTHRYADYTLPADDAAFLSHGAFVELR
jgi:hypothetical protein